MKKRGALSKEMSVLPTNEHSIQFDGKVLVTDNLNDEGPLDNQGKMQSFDRRFPMKLASACIIIVIKGSVKFSVNFRDFVAADNTCVIISSGTIIESVVWNEQTRLIFLSFSQKDLPAIASIHHKSLNRLYALQVVLLHLKPLHIEMALNNYSMLRTILTHHDFDFNREEAAFNCINLLGSIIAQGVTNQPEVAAKASRRDEIVARFLQSVHENYREHRDLGFYSDQLCLSLKYMSHVVFEQTGRHPSRWIKDYVILDAKTMLRSGRYTVQQVADELNFPNQSFFGKYFKEAVGVSPKKWK